METITPPPADWRAPQPPTYYAPVQRARTNGLAIASLVCSLVCVFGVGSVLGIIFGIVAKAQIRDAGAIGERQDGGGMATAGIVLGVLGIVGLVAFFALVGAAANHVSGQWSSYSDCMLHASTSDAYNTCANLLTR